MPRISELYGITILNGADPDPDVLHRDFEA